MCKFVQKKLTLVCVNPCLNNLVLIDNGSVSNVIDAQIIKALVVILQKGIATLNNIHK